MKTTFITTVFNEESTIIDFLRSIANQSEKPNEIVIVDGFSKDKTFQKIEEFKKKHKSLKIKLLKKRGNIAVGRNYAINNSKNSIILVSDAGCILDRDWIKNISKVFNDKGVDVASGFYKPLTKSTFEKCLATYTCVMPDKLDEKNYLPSSRSVGFRKSVWKSIGRYPEWLDTCEDLYFARELKKRGFKFKFVKDAIVLWPQRNNINEAFWQFFRYAIGDGRARYIRTNTPFLFARYVAGIILVLISVYFNHSIYVLVVLLLIGYIIWSIVKNYHYIHHLKAIIYLPLLQFVSDIAVIFGMSIGFAKSFAIKRKN